MLEHALLGHGLGVAVLNEEHSYEGKSYEYRSEEEEHNSHTEQVVPALVRALVDKAEGKPE